MEPIQHRHTNKDKNEWQCTWSRRLKRMKIFNKSYWMLLKQIINDQCLSNQYKQGNRMKTIFKYLLRKCCCFNCSSGEVAGVRGCCYTSSRSMNTLCICNSKDFTILFKSCSICCFKCLGSILNLHEHDHILLFNLVGGLKK